MSKPVWFCREFGVDGFVFIAVDMVMPSGALFGVRHAIQPCEVDNNPLVLTDAVAELSRAVERMSAPTQPTPRACAFSHHQEHQR